MAKRKTDYAIQVLSELEPGDFTEVVDKATDRLAEDIPKDGLVHVLELEDELKEVRATKGQMRGFSTGYSALDGKIGGLEPGSVVLIAGATSNGKSAVATNIAVNVAKSRPVLYISLEMTTRQMLERLDLMVGDGISQLELAFQKSFALSYRDLEPLVKRAVEELKVELVVLDYLQYLGRDMEHHEVARMSKEVKSIALRYGISMMVIVSLRKSDGKFARKWTEIGVDELMGTSALAYDADVIMLVSRKDEDDEYDPQSIYVKVLKSRNTYLDFRDNVAKLSWYNTKIS